jgi:hypothetical protein
VNIKEAILSACQAAPGTGREISDRVNTVGNEFASVTPNVVQAVVAKFGREAGIRRTLVERPTGYRGAMQKVSYYDAPPRHR